MYLATVDSATWMPSLSSSPWIRGAPHNPLARLISWIRSRISLGIAGRPPLDRDFHRQKPLISAIGIELQQERKQPEQSGHQHRAAVAILNIGGVHDCLQHQPLRIDQDVSLLARDLLAGVKGVRIDRAPPFSALFTLWLSITAAVGLVSSAICSRHFTYNA